MRARMHEPKNIEKPSIHEKTFASVNRSLDRATSRLREAINEDRLDDAWIAAADVANHAWMLVVKLEDKQADELRR